MWIYKGDSLRHRLCLNPTVGFWLDYWLFLHSDETHPLWCARPLGIRSVAEAAMASNGAHDATLRQQLKREVLACLQLAQYVSVLPVLPANSLTADTSEWDDVWLQWFEDVLRKADIQTLVSQVVAGIAEALCSWNLPLATFLTRRLAGELGGDQWTDQQLFKMAKQSLCDSGRFDDCELDESALKDAVNSLFAVPQNSAYSVELSLAPVPVSKFILRGISRGPVNARPQPISEVDDQQREILTGIRYSVDACHPEHAKVIALDFTRSTLDMLRLRFYIRTQLYGNVKVVDLTQGSELHLSIPQPFWTKERGRREVPSLPKRFNLLVTSLPEDDRERWYAARWHLSQAFADFAEDPHGAAAKVWQALEGFAPAQAGQGALRRVLQVARTYLESAPTHMAEFLATRVTLQSRELLNVLELDGKSPNWYYFDGSRITLHKWLSRVLDKRSTNHFTTWHTPRAPSILFDLNVGVLQIVARRLFDSTAEQWMDNRLAGDLALLYGLRNKVVHSGTTVLPRRMAMYLVQLGAEIIFAVMDEDAKPSSVAVPPT